MMVEEISMVAIWITVWAWFTWVEQGRLRLAEHTCIAAGVAFVDAAVLSYALPWMFFNLGWSWPLDMYNVPKTALITIAALIHLNLVSRKGLNIQLFALWLTASLLAMFLVTAQTWAKKNDRAAADKLPYASNIYAPTFVVTPEHKLKEGLEHMWSKSWADK